MRVTEEWRPVVGFENNYEVSNQGRIRSVSRKREVTQSCKAACFYHGRIRKQFLNKAGYYTVGLCKNGKQHHRQVSRIVAEAFLPNPNGYPEVNHKNETPKDNRVENLEWCSRKYNCQYGTRTKRIADKLSKSCCAIYPNGEKQVFKSIHEAAKVTGVPFQNIQKVCVHERSTAGGIRWEYCDWEVTE